MEVARPASGTSRAVAEATPLAQVVHSWELPLAIDQEAAALDAVAALGTAKGLEPEDYALILEEATERWQVTGAVDPQLRSAVDEALKATPDVLDEIDAKAYFEMYRRLRDGGGDVASLTHSVSRRLLSRASLVAHLLGEERFSCSQVARLLAATEASLDVPHGAISVIARRLGLLPALDRDAAGQGPLVPGLGSGPTPAPDSLGNLGQLTPPLWSRFFLQ